MPTFESTPSYAHGDADSLGVLVVNLGTPEEPTTKAVRRYLAEFLWDRRVVELPRALWWLILNGVILRFRPSRSAEAYAKIWTDDGSPLLLISAAICRGIGERLAELFRGPVHVALGMSYGKPSIDAALDELHAAGARRIVVLPLYPQYSGTTTGSVFDAVTGALSRRRWVPEFRFINHFHDDPAYIRALADSIREHWTAEGRGEKLLFSFHGVPRQTLLDGDPYHCHCQKTARLVVEELGLADDEWLLTFQSRVGRAEWLRPYTDETIEALGRDGLKRIDVVCPGFSADCLETLEEIAMQNGEAFVEAGGGELSYIPCLNTREDHLDLLGSIVSAHAGGWPESDSAYDADAQAAAREASRDRALAMGSER
ncbi:MAG: ferrochelatase [Pseudomonadota bacterium]